MKKNKLNPEKLLLSKTEAAELLSISYPSVNRHIKSGKIPSIQLGSRRLIPKAELVKMIEKLSSPNKIK